MCSLACLHKATQPRHTQFRQHTQVCHLLEDYRHNTFEVAFTPSRFKRAKKYHRLHLDAKELNEYVKGSIQCFELENLREGVFVAASSRGDEREDDEEGSVAKESV